MKIKFFCPIWGLTPLYDFEIVDSLEFIFKNIKDAGYDGIEMPIPFSKEQKNLILKLKDDYQLEVIALQHITRNTNINEICNSYRENVQLAMEVEPMLINSHTGADFYSFEDNIQILKAALNLESELNLKIVHETHRGRFSFHAPTTCKYLSALPALKITADFSHWCNVSESYLENQEENVLMGINAAHHIHSRVGFPQGPQVNDPRAPEWNYALNQHLKWWDAIVETRKSSGEELLTITTEFGPAEYMPTIPFTKQPIASQWDINVYMKDLLKHRYL